MVAVEVDAQAGEDARQFLHIALAVAAVHAHGVQFHQFARVVLVDVAGGVLLVVEVAQHRRMEGGGAQQVAKVPEGVHAQCLILVVADQYAQVALGLVYVEVVEPEPGHLLLQLRRRIQVAQQVAGRRFARQAVHFLLVALLRGFFLRVVGDRVRVLAALFQVAHQLQHRLPGDGHGADLRLHLGGQGCRRLRAQLLFQITPRSGLRDALHGGAIGTPGDAAGEPGAVHRGQRRCSGVVAAAARRGTGAAREQKK